VSRWITTLILLALLFGGFAAKAMGKIDDRTLMYYVIGLALVGIVVRFVEDRRKRSR
jgi:hypothetical protein